MRGAFLSYPHQHEQHLILSPKPALPLLPSSKNMIPPFTNPKPEVHLDPSFSCARPLPYFHIQTRCLFTGTFPLLPYKRSGFYPWFGKIPWRREWLPTPVFLPGESHGQRNLVGCKELDTTEWLTLSLSQKRFLFYLPHPSPFCPSLGPWQ